MNPLPPPLGDKIATPRQDGLAPGRKDPNEGLVSDTWGRWFADIVKVSSQSPNRIVDPIEAETQGASIATSTLAPGQTAAGLYRVTWYFRITTPAGVSSSLQVTIGFTDHGQAMSLSGNVVATNTVTSAQTATVMFYSDELTPITYSTTYASNPAGAMQYQLYITLEQMFQ